METPNPKMSDEDFIRKITEYEGDYLPLDKDRLVLFAVGFLESQRIEPTFDKIVIATFKLFPKKFSLIGFPEYPDGRTIYYCAFNHCTLTKKWLFGNVQSGFKITERGTYFLDETKKMLEGRIKITRTYKTVPRRKEATFVAMLKKTNAFKKYTQGRNEAITKSEINEALKIHTPNSKELSEAHLQRYLEYAKRINDPSAVKFLEFIRRRLGRDRDA